MKILQVVPVFSDPFGGPVTVVRSISKELAKKHDVVVYTTTALDPKHDFDPKEEEVNGYKVIYFKRTFKPLCYTGIFGQLNLSYGMMQAVKKTLRDFDVVHVHSWQQFPDVLVHHYATQYGVPYVLQVHGSLPKTKDRQSLKQIFMVLFGRKLMRDASKLIALSQIEVEQYGAYSAPTKKIAVIPNALSRSEFAKLPSKGSFREKYNVENDKKIILYLGRIHATKGIDLLIKAYAYLVNGFKYTNTILVIAGPDDGYLNEARCLANSLGVSNSVLFTGFIKGDDKIRAFVDADVFVTPSFYGFPVTFLESCAIGLPIVTTTLGDTLDWIDNNVGFATPPTHFDIAKAINSILSNDELHRHFSVNCRNIVQTTFSSEQAVNTLTQVYQAAVDGNEKGKSRFYAVG